MYENINEDDMKKSCLLGRTFKNFKKTEINVKQSTFGMPVGSHQLAIRKHKFRKAWIVHQYWFCFLKRLMVMFEHIRPANYIF